jgi:hypothetical protein
VSDSTPVITSAQKSMILARLMLIEDSTRRQLFLDAVSGRLRLTAGRITDGAQWSLVEQSKAGEAK